MMAARRTLLSDLAPASAAWIRRARQDDPLTLVRDRIAPRRETVDEGNGWQTTVVRGGDGTEPSRDDVAAALRAAPGDAALVDYVVARFILQTRPCKPGPQGAPRNVWDEIEVVFFYARALRKARARRDEGLCARPAERAKSITARRFGLSVRALEAILVDRPLP